MPDAVMVAMCMIAQIIVYIQRVNQYITIIIINIITAYRLHIIINCYVHFRLKTKYFEFLSKRIGARGCKNIHSGSEIYLRCLFNLRSKQRLIIR